MACNSATCQSGGCYREDNGDKVDDQFPQPPPAVATESTQQPLSNGKNSDSAFCIKCKLKESMAAAFSSSSASAQVTGGGGGGGRGGASDSSRFCGDCFRSNLYGKFRLAVTSNALISPSDNVLVAFSGGPSSRVALQFVHEMQMKAQKNFDASRDRSLPVFGVGVAFIVESSSISIPADKFSQAVEEMRLVVSNLAPPVKEFHVVSTESIYSSDSNNGRNRLKELLNAVADVTGKEDLLVHLRMLALQKVALKNGYTKVLLGTCTSRIACRVLEATVKGQGYSLAADIQYVDARWEIPVILPLHDCLAQELNIMCSLDSLKTVEVHNDHHSGINALITSFVKLLQEENPSRESTIVRTAGKLTPFHFNRMPEPDDCNMQLASQRRQKKYNLKPNESLPPESFCRICNSPLKKSDVKSYKLENQIMSAEDISNGCCTSCQFQILPKDISLLEHFYSLLPQQMVARGEYSCLGEDRWLREQIQDYLLSDTEDGT
ncbi:cytoplasmic tRNA 2-thiolation protein 2 [Coffea eugenioides]|uniref:cytoplasmic tRNA 2-thiolation protein 2 n=1 Tax=Coffea eugenioides TaxID=49369 RepID=UPI000F6052A3|nr:cytoplasmic tRNA 2-thiolation protein 2 [Coffea eugenioides]